VLDGSGSAKRGLPQPLIAKIEDDIRSFDFEGGSRSLKNSPPQALLERNSHGRNSVTPKKATILVVDERQII